MLYVNRQGNNVGLHAPGKSDASVNMMSTRVVRCRIPMLAFHSILRAFLLISRLKLHHRISRAHFPVAHAQLNDLECLVVKRCCLIINTRGLAAGIISSAH